MLTAGIAAAQGPIALVTGEGGGEAAGEVQGDYYADASGAVDAVHENHADAKSQAEDQWDATNRNYAETEAHARSTIKDAEMPERPECDCGEQAFDELDQVSEVQASHADKVHKAADVETEYVDAGANLDGAAEANAWYKDAFNGLKDTFVSAKDMLAFETDAVDDVKEAADGLFETDDEVRGQVDSVIKADQDLPDPDPSIEGEMAAEHASQITSEATGHGEATIP